VKSFASLSLILTITLILSACGTTATPPPTLDPVDLQNTAAAVAFTMVAQTQTALPTATPPPPTSTSTETPAASVTVPPLPSLGATFTTSPDATAGGPDPCIDQVLPATLEGETVRIRINNSTRATLSVSVYLQQTTPQSVCGYRSYTLGPEQFVVLNDLVEGCYTLWAWNPDPDEYFIVTNGTSCIDDSDTWVFDISTGSITLRT
jgi:hypothetical protein